MCVCDFFFLWLSVFVCVCGCVSLFVTLLLFGCLNYYSGAVAIVTVARLSAGRSVV